jgi:hypothetical protein
MPPHPRTNQRINHWKHFQRIAEDKRTRDNEPGDIITMKRSLRRTLLRSHHYAALCKYQFLN